jgi:hypothetical protein
MPAVKKHLDSLEANLCTKNFPGTCDLREDSYREVSVAYQRSIELPHLAPSQVEIFAHPFKVSLA